MKRIKLTLALLALGLLALLFYQNQAYFLQPQTLSLDLYFKKYMFPEAPEGVYWVLCFGAGFLMMFFSSLVLRFRTGSRIRLLQKESLEHLEIIDALQKELEDRHPASAKEVPPTENTEEPRSHAV